MNGPIGDGHAIDTALIAAPQPSKLMMRRGPRLLQVFDKSYVVVPEPQERPHVKNILQHIPVSHRL